MKTVLFLCGHNAGRSQMAEAYFNHTRSGDGFKAISAGTNPSDKINYVVKDLLEEEGIETSDLSPKMLTKEMLDKTDLVFTMGCNVDCGVFDFPVKIERDFGLDDPHGKSKDDVKQVFENLKKIIEKLTL